LLRHRATSRKVMVPNYVGAIGIFHCLNLSGCTMTLRSTQSRTKMSTMGIFCRRNIAWLWRWGLLDPSKCW
jgi:hypothetical protein